ncbi:transglutaminase domain-containing protein [Cohnella sp. WQ 127256]|uniref:transglutaminase domain-containing protein n=1 Tax=Cohnella sp. WQ 127256 TaxID=2938790 RepID=UPI0021190923|nr:transglutaminase domain-containing protein [Cohnella sp. WQ 127256]
MNNKIRALLASALLVGTAPLATGCDLIASIQTATKTTNATSAMPQTQVHEEIVNALSQRLDTLEVTYSGTEDTLKQDIKDILNNAINADDYLHYIVKTYGYNAKITGTTATITFSFTYWETLSQTNEVKKRVAEALKQILTPGMNDHQKEKAIHDWIVTNVAYDTRLISYSAYDGLVNGSTVCQGYALLTYEMMKQAGIPVKIVEGSSRNIAHTWNLVQIDDEWYHLDTTWDDPVPDVVGRVVYNYYNLPDAELRSDHTWEPSTRYPTAVTSYNQTLTALTVKGEPKADFYNTLYEQLGYIYLTAPYTATNLQDLTSRIRVAVKNGRKELVLRYTQGSTVESDMKKAFSAQKGLSKYRYSYEDFTRTTADDKILRIEFYYS